MTSESRAESKDFKAHASTYGGFVGLVKWSAIAAAVTVAVVVALLVS